MEGNNSLYEGLFEILKQDAVTPPVEVLEKIEAFQSFKTHISNLIEAVFRKDLISDDISFAGFQQQFVETPINRLIEQELKPWLSDKTIIGLVGHFSAGKTSVLNCIFNEHFPVDKGESTALPSYLIHGTNTDEYSLVDKDGNVQVITHKQASVFDYKSDQEFPFAKMFDYIVKENHSEILDSVSIIDTPGLWTKHKGHTTGTLKTSKQCDIIFWVKPVRNVEMDQDEIDFIKANFSGKPIYFIFTFTDKIGVNTEQGIAKILKTAQEKEIEVQGYLKFGKSQAAQESFKKDFWNLYEEKISKFEKYNPLVLIGAGLRLMQNIIVSRQQKLAEAIETAKEKADAIANKYKASLTSYNTAHSHMITRFNNMISTFNNRCSSAAFCGGASSALLSDINSLSSSVNSLTNAYNNIDSSALVDYGNLVVLMSQFENESTELDDLKKSFTEALSLFENDN